MKRAERWLKRVGAGVGCLLWFIVMCLPLFAFVLAVRGEMTWKRGEFTEDRIWLIQEIEEQGLGWSSAHVISNHEANGGPICVQTTVRFLMWKGTAEGAAYCECYAAGSHEEAGGCG